MGLFSRLVTREGICYKGKVDFFFFVIVIMEFLLQQLCAYVYLQRLQ